MEPLTVAALDFTTATLAGVIIGGVLCGLGALWFFLITWVPPRRRGAAGAAPADEAPSNPLVELIDQFFKWFTGITKRLKAAYLPGLIMLALGVVVIGISLGFAAWGGKGSSGGSTSTTTTTSTNSTTTQGTTTSTTTSP